MYINEYGSFSKGTQQGPQYTVILIMGTLKRHPYFGNASSMCMFACICIYIRIYIYCYILMQVYTAAFFFLQGPLACVFGCIWIFRVLAEGCPASQSPCIYIYIHTHIQSCVYVFETTSPQQYPSHPSCYRCSP